jgi:hypothetical protein
MNLTPRRLLGVVAAVTTGATALLGTGAGPAAASGRAYCDRAERPVWSGDPSRNITAYGCNLPDDDGRWYTVDIDTLLQPHYKDYDNGPVAWTDTLHDETIRCMGYTTDDDRVNWFGCLPS